MRFQKQMFYHRPELGIYGDCQRTCIASMLDMDKFDVPNFGVHFNDPDAFNAATAKFLASQGYIEVCTAFTGTLEQVLHSQSGRPDLYYLLAGTSRTGCNHIVIGKGDQIAWDPSLTGSGIVGPCDDGYYFISHLVQTRFCEPKRIEKRLEPVPCAQV